MHAASKYQVSEARPAQGAASTNFNDSTDCVADYLVKQDTHLQSCVRDARRIRRAEPALVSSYSPYLTHQAELATQIAPIDPTLIEDALKCMQDRLDGHLRAIEPPKGAKSPSYDGADIVALESGAWTLVDKHAWTQCAMGTLPGGVLPPLSLIAT